LLLFPLGTGLVWLGNGVRIAALVAVGNWLSPAIATTGFHSQAGWLAFLGVALGLTVLTRSTGFFRACDPAEPAPRGDNPTAAYARGMALEPLAVRAAANDAPPAELGGWPAGWAGLWLAFRVLGSVVTVPVAEGLAFRGYLLRRLIALDFQEVPLGRFTWMS